MNMPGSWQRSGQINMAKAYSSIERRKFVRFDYITPLAYKVCKRKTVSKLLEGYTSDISQLGLRCNIKEEVAKNIILWLSFERSTLEICRQIDNKCLLYQNGVLGKVVWAEKRINNSYDVGIRFITREEKNFTNIYPKAYFLSRQKENEK
jgi:c-di-GMP-binding flagellar brake protein YcgR